MFWLNIHTMCCHLVSKTKYYIFLRVNYNGCFSQPQNPCKTKQNKQTKKSLNFYGYEKMAFNG